MDRTLCAIAEQEAWAARLIAEAEDRIRAIREDAAARAASGVANVKRLRGEVEAFSEAHAEEFGAARSRALPHGRVGWRKVTKIRLVRKAAHVVAALESRGLADAVIVKKQPNKDVLATFVDQTLRDVGARRATKDQFFIDLQAETPPCP